jgi:hypothetical protein
MVSIHHCVGMSCHVADLADNGLGIMSTTSTRIPPVNPVPLGSCVTWPRRLKSVGRYFRRTLGLTGYDDDMKAKTPEAQQILAALDDELAASAKSAGRDLVWSAKERDVLGMVGAAVDRRVELSAAYEQCESVTTKLKIATELRLLEGSISRLYRQVSTELPAPMSLTSLKAQRAVNVRWDRERMKSANAT